MKASFLFLAEGFEEMEAITTIDIMRRAGFKLNTVSISSNLDVTGAHGVTIKADSLFNETNFTDAEWLILPGGLPGASNLAEFQPLNELLIAHYNNNGNIAAICASPAVVLAPLGILDDREAICYPGFEDAMKSAKKGYMPVCQDGNIITANGPSAATAFALAIVAKSIGEECAREVAEGLLLYNRKHQNYYF